MALVDELKDLVKPELDEMTKGFKEQMENEFEDASSEERSAVFEVLKAAAVTLVETLDELAKEGKLSYSMSCDISDGTGKRHFEKSSGETKYKCTKETKKAIKKMLKEDPYVDEEDLIDTYLELEDLCEDDDSIKRAKKDLKKIKKKLEL